jgi:lysophospholipase L1-like esterase
MTSPSSALKWVLPACTWPVLIYLALHQSQNPTVLDRWSFGYAMLLALWAFLTLLATACLATPFRRVLIARRTAFGSLIAGLILAVFVGEVALRTIDPLGFAYYGEMQRYIHMRQTDEQLVYTQPASTEVVLDGTRVRYNSLGLRGPELTAKLPAEKRVLFLGDSVVFGWGVKEEYLFVNGVARRLEESTGHAWSGINAGVCSYNTEQEELYLTTRGFQLDPDLIVLVLIDNDVLTYSDQWKSQAAAPSPIRRLQKAMRTSFLYRLVHHALDNGLGGVALEGAERSVVPGTPGWEDNMQALTRLTKICHAKDIPLAIFHFRWATGTWTDTFLESAREHAGPLPIIDSSSWFEDAPLTRWVNSATDSHPNAQAHDRTAKKMVAVIEEQGLLEGE